MSAVPEKLGKYPIEGVLGKGAMGIVYRAVDPVIKRPVAIKTIRKEMIEDDEHAGALAARFRNEAQAAGRLHHPGIVTVYEYGEDGEYAYIAMEYVEGNSLRTYFGRDTRFEPRDVVSLMSQLLEGLDYAHENQVWHRDIKPANLIITTAGRLKIADFGIARVEASGLTQAGSIMGTPGYIAPEFYMGEAADRRVDIFSAGAVMYQLLANTPAFSGNAEAIMYKVCHEAPPAPSALLNDEGIAHFDAVVAKALAKKAADRFQTAGAFRTAMLAAYNQPVSQTLSEETIICEVPRAMPLPGRDSLPGSSPSLARTAPPTGWDATELFKVENRLARVVGPMAKVMVRRAAQQTGDLNTLITQIAEQLSTVEERRTFLDGLQGGSTRIDTSTQALPQTSLGSGGPAGIPVEVLQNTEKLLTAHLGPIARVIVKRQSGRARDVREFYLYVAESIDSEAERRKFLQNVGVL